MNEQFQARLSPDELAALEASIDTLLGLHVQTSIAIERVKAELLLLRQKAPKRTLSRPVLDHSRFAVCWDTRVCILGHTLLFRLIERFLRRPDHFISETALLQDVWRGDIRSPHTVRSAIRHLRRRLINARMSHLSKCIQCTGHHYGLILRRPRRT